VLPHLLFDVGFYLEFYPFSFFLVYLFSYLFSLIIGLSPKLPFSFRRYWSLPGFTLVFRFDEFVP